jgi:hypothetical protein
MIHNLYNELLIDDFKLETIFPLNKEKTILVEKDRERDSLFEFLDR